MSNEYEEAKKKLKKMRQQVVEIARGYFEKESKRLFVRFPELKSFSWTQFTDSFNDGEPCRFHAHTDIDFITLNGISADDDGPDQLPEEVYEAVSDFLSIFEDSDLEAMFGDHKEVTVHPNEIEVESYYDHD